jgi:EAL domain-containing protein (putative c-di-GMP-specific phosphodiesterase class I)
MYGSGQLATITCDGYCVRGQDCRSTQGVLVEDHLNHLKIAQSFINRSSSDPECAATIRAIVNFARDIGIGVIAQGVETEQQRNLLTSTDTKTQAQGFHFSKAVGADRAGDLLRRGRIALMPLAG